jgi:hypothetical protein
LSFIPSCPSPDFGGEAFTDPDPFFQRQIAKAFSDRLELVTDPEAEAPRGPVFNEAKLVVTDGSEYGFDSEAGHWALSGQRFSAHLSS